MWATLRTASRGMLLRPCSTAPPTYGARMRARVRTAITTVRLVPWRRAPFLSLRRPGVLASVSGASALLAAALASVPVFLSSVGTEAVAVQAGDRCSRDTGATYGFLPTEENVTAPAPDPFAPLRADLG